MDRKKLATPSAAKKPRLRVSDHAERRLQQRGFIPSDLELIEAHGTPCVDGVLLRTKDVVAAEADYKRTINRLYRLQGAVAIIRNRTFVTVHRTSRAQRRRKLRLGKYLPHRSGDRPERVPDPGDMIFRNERKTTSQSLGAPMTESTSTEALPRVPREVENKIAAYVDWIFTFYDPDPDAPFSRAPGPGPPCWRREGARFSDVYDDERLFAIHAIDGSEVLQFTVEEAAAIWRKWRAALDRPVSAARFQRTVVWAHAYFKTEYPREWEEPMRESLNHEWDRAIRKARSKAPPDEGPGSDPKGPHPDEGASHWFESHDDRITAYQIRQALRAETVDPEEREEISTRIRHAECFRFVPRPDAEGLDSDSGFSEAAAAQERERLIRERATFGVDMTAEERAELTVRIIQLGGF